MKLIVWGIKALPLLILLGASGALGAATQNEEQTQTLEAGQTQQSSDIDVAAPVQPSPTNTTIKTPRKKNKPSTGSRDFKPSEEISEDFSVPFPVDI